MYKFVYYKNVVSAISSFAGKIVKGSAKCDPQDEFDRNYGERLALARCNTKVSKRRVAQAKAKLQEAHREAEKANKRVIKMEEYLADAYDMEYNCRETERAILAEKQ